MRDITMKCIHEFNERLKSWASRNVELSSHDGLCFCGTKMASVSFYAWGRKPVCEGAKVYEDGIIQCIGLSCTRPRCEGNFKEVCEAQADQKLRENQQAIYMDGIDREALRDMGILA